jgi:hypothetical protein
MLVQRMGEEFERFVGGREELERSFALSSRQPPIDERGEKLEVQVAISRIHPALHGSGRAREMIGLR